MCLSPTLGALVSIVAEWGKEAIEEVDLGSGKSLADLTEAVEMIGIDSWS